MQKSLQKKVEMQAQHVEKLLTEKTLLGHVLQTKRNHIVQENAELEQEIARLSKQIAEKNKCT